MLLSIRQNMFLKYSKKNIQVLLINILLEYVPVDRY